MTTQNPTLAEVFDRAVHDRLRETFGGWFPARIESYDEPTNRATVQILLYDDYEDEEGGRQIEAMPPLSDVPVGWLSLGGAFVLRSTISVGDEGIYMCPARPTTKWLQVGGMVDPEDGDHHPLDGGIFLPYRISASGGNADPMIEITASSVKIGGNSALAFASELNDLRTKYTGHTHLDPVSGSTGTPSAPSGTVYGGTQKLRGG